MNKLTLVTPFLLARVLFAQGGGLEPADLLKPLSTQWSTYSGDYSGKRYSELKQINTNTVKNLSLAWVNNGITTGCGPTGTAPGGGGGGMDACRTGFGDGGGAGGALAFCCGRDTSKSRNCFEALSVFGALCVSGVSGMKMGVIWRSGSA